MLKTIVILIALYELGKILNLKLHSEAFEHLTNFSKIKNEDDRQSYIENMKHPVLTFFIIVNELLYLLIAIILLFTPLVWISAIMIILSITVGIVDIVTDKKYKSLLKLVDSMITIGLLVFAFHIIL